MKEKFAKSKNIAFLDSTVKIMSGVKPENVAQIDAMADELCRA